MTKTVEATGTTSFVYDLLNRQVAKSLPGQGAAACPGPTTITATLCYTFDAASNLTAYTDTTASPGVTCNSLTVGVCYGYNTLNELTNLVDPATKTTTFGYDANHRRTTTTYPGNTVQTATYDNAQRLTAIKAVNGTNVLTNYSYSYTNPATTTDTMLIFTGSQSDSFSHTATITNTYDVLNHLTEWQLTKGTGSVLNNHDYVYHYDGNGNRTYIMPDTTTNETNLFYNAANEWYQSTDHIGNVNVISWDAAGNLVGNNGFGGSHPLTVTYNAKERRAIQTDTGQHVSPMTLTGPGQFERVSDTDSNGTRTYTYSLLGLTRAVGSTATYVRDPNGGLVSQQNVTGGPYYYLADGQGNVGGMADSNGGQAAGYLNCPTGNTAEAPWGSNPLVNPYRQYGAYYHANFQSYWMNGQQYDANSGNAFGLNLSPDQVQSDLLANEQFGTNMPVVLNLANENQAGVPSIAGLTSDVVLCCAGFALAAVGVGAARAVDLTITAFAAGRASMVGGLVTSGLGGDAAGLVITAGATIAGLAALAIGGEVGTTIAVGIAVVGAAYSGVQCAQAIHNQTNGGP